MGGTGATQPVSLCTHVDPPRLEVKSAVIAVWRQFLVCGCFNKRAAGAWGISPTPSEPREHSPSVLHQDASGAQQVPCGSSPAPKEPQGWNSLHGTPVLRGHGYCLCSTCWWSRPSRRYSEGSQLRWKIMHVCLLSAMDNLQERALHIRKVLLVLPKTTLIIMRYLFAFLNQ